MIPRAMPPTIRGTRLRLAFLPLLLFAACQPTADEPASRSEAAQPATTRPATAESGAPDSTGEPASATRAALPGLFAVMSGLEQDMGRLSRGLWAADFDTITAAAHAIATHPTVPPTEAQRIAAILGADMAAFKGVDTEVHDLAVRVRELARERDMAAITTAEAGLRQGCITCHTRFRERIRDGIR